MRNPKSNLKSSFKETRPVGSNTGKTIDLKTLASAGTSPTAAAATPAAVGNTPIDNPNLAYLLLTKKIDISGLTIGDSYSSISDSILTVTFSVPLEKQGPVPTGWATWSSPPFSEDPNPDVLVSPTNTLEMVLSRPVRIFGFELEPEPFGEFTYTANFFRGNLLVESITRTVNGSAGARLFARTGEPIDRVLITGGPTFAIAQVRYALPLSLLLIGLIVLAIILLLLWLLL